jgi:hypothetical protein
LFLESGLLGVLLLSNDAQLPVVLVDRGGLALLILPRASFSVVTPPGSSRALFNIVAAASELEKLGASMGRCLDVCEKNRGEGGDPNCPLGKVDWKLSGSSVCRGLNLGWVLFGGLSVETGIAPLSSDRGCFDVFRVGVVMKACWLCGISGLRNVDLSALEGVSCSCNDTLAGNWL